ncbi:MAG: hypothetical protein A2V46_15820 [Bacteroidetes bacterium RBG_19FT_COMBO_42_7]|nr:MAG: hypothetical protein A2V46_15820 [Bacteroidetes bacterium RBG_19FT_COMBO_42_7]
MIIRVNSALTARGKYHFLILIRQKRSTSGRPIIEKTPETKIYTTIFLKYHSAARKSNIPKKIRMFLKVAFICD